MERERGLTADDEEGREGARAAVVLAPGRLGPVYPMCHVCDRVRESTTAERCRGRLRLMWEVSTCAMTVLQLSGGPRCGTLLPVG